MGVARARRRVLPFGEDAPDYVAQLDGHADKVKAWRTISVDPPIVIGWSGMRGIVTLAAAMALPAGFPYRDFIQLTAFVVVLGTLVIQGLTLRPLLKLVRLPSDGTVQRELQLARATAIRAAMDALPADDTPTSRRLRDELAAALEHLESGAAPGARADNVLRRCLVAKSRHAVQDLRLSGAIGDDAYRQVEAELDWVELSAGEPE